MHANTQVPAHRRDQLERLIHYTARGAVSLERLAQDANGDLVYTFTHPWSDGTTGIRLSPMELLEKLAALVPLPRVHLVRYGGCLAPHSHLRAVLIPTPRQQGVEDEETDTGSSRCSWARLLKRVFALDMARCPWCQREVRRIIATISHGEVIRKTPPASEARRGPTSHCPGAFPPSSLRLVLRLTAPGASSPGQWVGRHGRPASACCTAIRWQPSHAVRPCVLSHPMSQLLAQQQPLRRVAACARGLKPSHCNSPRRLNSGLVLPYCNNKSQTFEPVFASRPSLQPLRRAERAAGGLPGGLAGVRGRWGWYPVARGKKCVQNSYSLLCRTTI